MTAKPAKIEKLTFWFHICVPCCRLFTFDRDDQTKRKIETREPDVKLLT